MRWLIASDIHGSAYYCRELLEACGREDADRLVLLGDILYHGPRNDLPVEYDPKQVATMLNAQKDRILCIRGNCEAEVDQMMLEFPVMAEYAVIDTGRSMVYLTHGHKYNIDNPLPMSEGDVMIYGHTHIPFMQEKDGISYCNPGSVSLPKANSRRGYILMDENGLEWKPLEPDEYEEKSRK